MLIGNIGMFTLFFWFCYNIYCLIDLILITLILKCLIFSKYPDKTRKKQFIRFYLEEKYKLEKKPMSDITENVIDEMLYWSELCYMFAIFFYAGMWKCLR